MSGVLIGDCDANVCLYPTGEPAIGFPARIVAQAGSLRIEIEDELMGGAERFSHVCFADALANMHKTLTGDAQLSTLEDQFALTLVATGRGKINGSIKIRSSDINLRVQYDVHFDQSYLPAMISALKNEFPRL